MNTSIAVSQAQKLAVTFGIEADPKELILTLKATAFKGEVTDAQFNALLIVAGQYGLNPFTKEIYAFPDKSNGIVPIVGVDGWNRIMNNQKQYDGMEFVFAEEQETLDGMTTSAPIWVECHIHRKDRSKPTIIREYLDETYRPPFKGKYGPVIGPWQSHPKRMLRHKAMIQCARIAFGFSGIHDEDEAERIMDSGPKNVTPQATAINTDLQAKKDEIEALTMGGDWEVIANKLQNELSKEQRIELGGSEWMATLKSACDLAASKNTIDGTATVIVEQEALADDGLLI